MSYANTTPSIAPWDTPGLPPRTPAQRCQWHFRLCAYRDDDPRYCPLCHASVASTKCTCIEGDGTLTDCTLNIALIAAATLTPKELAANYGLTPATAKRLWNRAHRRAASPETENAA